MLGVRGLLAVIFARWTWLFYARQRLSAEAWALWRGEDWGGLMKMFVTWQLGVLQGFLTATVVC